MNPHPIPCVVLKSPEEPFEGVDPRAGSLVDKPLLVDCQVKMARSPTFCSLAITLILGHIGPNIAVQTWLFLHPQQDRPSREERSDDTVDSLPLQCGALNYRDTTTWC